MTNAETLADAIVAPPGALVEDEVRQHVRHRLLRDVPALVGRLAPGSQAVVTLSSLRRAPQDPGSLAPPMQPFEWKPIFVRRSLGLASIGACLRGRFPTPAEAVGPVADDAVGEWRRTGWRSFHWEPWFAGLAPGSRAAVLAEAATWSTVLWSSLDWARLDRPPVLGGPDDRWTCAATRTVRLKARSELRVPIGAGAGGHGRPVALLSVAGGLPTDDWAAELGFLALVAGLRTPSRPVPSRVIGFWPDAGLHRTVEVGSETLVAAAGRVVAAIAAYVDTSLPLAEAA